MSITNGKLPNFSINWSLFSETEIKMLQVLQDGVDHGKPQLKECLPDPKYTSDANLSNYISNLRRKLRMINHDIVCVVRNRKGHYRWVRSILSDEDDAE
jgi:hypothetical protein